MLLAAHVLVVDQYMFLDGGLHLVIWDAHALVEWLVNEVAAVAILAALYTMVIFARVRFWASLPGMLEDAWLLQVWVEAGGLRLGRLATLSALSCGLPGFLIALCQVDNLVYLSNRDTLG